MKSVKDLRSELGMSQTRFSEFTGVPYRTIQNWELEVSKCPDYTLALLNEQIRPYTEDFDITYTRYTWITSEESRCDEQLTMFLTREAAKDHADMIWGHLTKGERKETTVSIGMCELKVDDTTCEAYPDTADGVFYLEAIGD